MNFNKIKTICEDKGLTVPQLADKIGISEAGLYQSFRNQSMKVDVLEKIAQTLDTPIWVFFDLNPEAQVETLRKEIQNYKEKFDEITTKVQSLKKEREQMIEKLLLKEVIIQNQQMMIEIQKKIDSNEEFINNSAKVMPKMMEAFDVIKKVMTGKIKIGSPEANKIFDFNPEDYPLPKRSRKDKK